MDLDLSLYLVTDPTVMRKRLPEDLLIQAIRGGVSVVQLREKDCSNEEFLILAKKMKAILREKNIPFLINDRVDIAIEVGADGVHVGQNDMHWSEARRQLGKNSIIGVSVNRLSQANELEKSDINYLGVGAIYPTQTKKDVSHIWGIEGLQDLRKKLHFLLWVLGGLMKLTRPRLLKLGQMGLQ